jgi:hypothetical protein
MYDNQTAKAEENGTLFSKVGKTLERINNLQREVIDGIETKLHQISNQRSPEKSPEANVMLKQNTGVDDFYTGIMNELSKSEHQTQRLETILKHISSII